MIQSSKGQMPAQVSGVVPDWSQSADLGPPRSECGIGCLMPWNGKLYILSYVSHKKKTGTGTGLQIIDEGYQIKKHPNAVDGTYANRFVHRPSNRMIIGPHVVTPDHTVHTIPELIDIRLTGTCLHLTNPEHLVYMLGMEGELFELNVQTLECNLVEDLSGVLGTEEQGKTHYKDCFSAYGRLVVCSNEYHEPDWKGERAQGRLAEWDGKTWTIIKKSPFVCIHGHQKFGQTIFATGWDRASALLMVFTNVDQKWTTYRLPKASHCFDHKWQTEWPRIREVEHERFLMDHHGMWYELSAWAYGGRIWGVRPISTHLWVHADFCTWKGMLVIGSDNGSPGGGYDFVAEPQSGIWCGKTDDLWALGKVKGWGGPWWDTPVDAQVASDPYLMTGFDQKCLHISSDSAMNVRIEIDFKGCGEWSSYQTLAVEKNGYTQHTFPSGFSAHWVRLVPDNSGVVSGQFFYT